MSELTSFGLFCRLFLCFFWPHPYVPFGLGALQCKSTMGTLNSVSKEVLFLSKILRKKKKCWLPALLVNWERSWFLSLRWPCNFSFQSVPCLCSFSHTAVKGRSELISRVEVALPCWRQQKTDLPPVEGCLVMFYVTTLKMHLKKGAWDVSV